MRLEITDTRTLTDAKPDVRELQFRNIPVPVGSGSNNLVQLPDMNIAPHHATLRPMGEHWVYEPMLTDEGTKINGQPVGDSVELGDGDVIEIRHFELRIMLDEEVVLEPAEVVQPGDLIKIKQYPLPPRSVVRKPDVNVSLTPPRRKTLASITAEWGECASLAALLERMVDLLLQEYAARAVWVGVRNDVNGPLEFIEGRTDQAARFDEPPKLETFIYRCLSRSQFITIPRTGEADTQSVLAVPIFSARGAIGLIHIDSRKHTRIYDEPDLDFLTLLADLVSPRIETLLAKGALTAATTDGADALAVPTPKLIHKIRSKCRIETPPSWPTLQTALFARDGEESVGDVCDVMKLPNGLAAFLIGHVDAEPLRTAAAIAEIRGAFRVAGLHADPPHVQLKALNWLLSENPEPCRVEIAVLVINPKTGTMEIAAAGKMGVLSIDADGQPRRVGPASSPPLGAAKSADYTGTTDRLDEGHTLALFTRGCIKAQNDAGDPIGEKRFLAALCKNIGEPAPAALDDFLSETAAFFRQGQTPDDLTLLLATRIAT